MLLLRFGRAAADHRPTSTERFCFSRDVGDIILEIDRGVITSRTMFAHELRVLTIAAKAPVSGLFEALGSPPTGVPAELRRQALHRAERLLNSIRSRKQKIDGIGSSEMEFVARTNPRPLGQLA